MESATGGKDQISHREFLMELLRNMPGKSRCWLSSETIAIATIPWHTGTTRPCLEGRATREVFPCTDSLLRRAGHPVPCSLQAHIRMLAELLALSLES